MNHESAREKLLDLAYGELSRREAAEVEAHLEGCAECRAERDRIAATRAAMRRLEPEAPPEAGERILLAAARQAAERQRERPGVLVPRWVWRVSLTTVLLAVVGAVTLQIVGLRERTVREELRGAPERASPRAEAPAAQAPAPAVAPQPARPEEEKVAKSAERLAAPARKEAPPAAAPAAREAIARRDAEQAAPARSAAPALAEQAPAAERPMAQARAKAADRAVAAAPPAPAGGAIPVAGAAADAAGAEAKAKGEAQPRAAESAGPEKAAPAGPAAGFAAPAPSLAAEPEGKALRLGAGNWKASPEIAEVRGIVREVDRKIRAGALRVSARPFQACGPAEDAERRIYAGADGRTAKFVRQLGSAEAALTFEEYYDQAGRLRYVFVHGGAVNGALLEHRIWLDAEGNRLWEEQKLRRGSYPFPASWPERDLWLTAPGADVLGCGNGAGIR